MLRFTIRDVLWLTVVVALLLLLLLHLADDARRGEAFGRERAKLQGKIEELRNATRN